MEVLQYPSVRPLKRSRATRNLFHALSAIALAATSSPNLWAQQAPLAHFAPPPMGWGSWNSFSNTVDSQIVASQGRAMIATGMRSAGYQIVMIEEGWWLGKRDADGNIIVDAQQWPALAAGEKPADMANIARYLHGLGLKPGIYTDAGSFGCSYDYPDLGPPRGHTGSLGHYDQDFLQFARQGFDYVKVDWCGGEASNNLDPATQYAEIARAIERARALTGRSLFFSICEWGNQSPWSWAPGIADLPEDVWRTSDDITAPLVDVPAEAKRRVSLQNVFKNFDPGIHPEAQHTGYYNDLDMMVLGMRGMTLADDRVHMSLWAISGAPLIVGADLTKLTQPEVAILTNRDAVAIDQDPLGVQAIKVAEESPGLQVWAKPMPKPGDRAVVLLNRTAAAAPVTVRWASIGLLPQANADVKDVWTGKDLGTRTSLFTATVPPHDVSMLIISGRAVTPVIYRPDPRHGPRASRRACAAERSGAWNAADIVAFNGVAAPTEATYIEVEYKNTGKNPVVGDLRVNGQTATRLQFPPTSAFRSGIGMVPLEVKLDKAGADNIIRFSSPCIGGALTIQAVKVLPW